MLTKNRRTPFGLLVFAGLLFAFAGDANAQKTCKPRVDKGNIAVELTIPNFNAGQRVVLSMPAKAKEMRAFGGALPNQSANHASPVTYSVTITEKNNNGVTLDLNVSTQNKNGSWQITRRTIVLPHETIVEQRYMTGVQVKAYFKLRPFNCKSL
ncbi:MAG TPA: hypothetical protein VEX70_08320 [Pyrinomonadaceae bacterium]|jgi:hypothetical protein|nr:hypothetical protein [Pyrinomonadaceae bacterium]